MRLWPQTTARGPRTRRPAVVGRQDDRGVVGVAARTVTLRNDFHDTTVDVRVPKDGRLSMAQVRRIRRELCGIHDCRCGAVRGPQDVEYQPEADGTAIVR